MKQILLITAILLLITGCAEQKIAQQKSEDTTASTQQLSAAIETDKETYHSSEMMSINITLSSNTDIENASVRIYGIEASGNRIDISKQTNIKQGKNTVNFEYTTPKCNTCSGIKPGTYQLNTEVMQKGEIIAKTSKDINIQQ